MRDNDESPDDSVREDVNNSGTVHFMDLIAVSGHYGQTW